MTSADVRTRLAHALRLDLIGPLPGEAQVTECLPAPPSRWYLTGFLVPWAAPLRQKTDEEDSQGELGFAEPSSGADEDDSPEPAPAARKGHFPSSIGLSVLVPLEATRLRVSVRWGDYAPREVGSKPDVVWDRTEHVQAVDVVLNGVVATPPKALVPESGGLEVMTSVRTVRNAATLSGLPAGARAVSVFLVNQRTAEEHRDELKDQTFAFQVGLTLECDQPFLARPNARGLDGDDPDERIAELQYRDVMEYAVGHGVSVRNALADGVCRRVETDWMPCANVERVEPSIIGGVEFRMEALANLSDGGAVNAALTDLASTYREWIERQRRVELVDSRRREVADALMDRAELAARRIEDGLAVLQDPQAFESFRLMNVAMATAARQRRAVEQSREPAAVDSPAWRPFQLAFILMNLRGIADPTHADRERVDLLFFPTGGGKTEAYLGLAAFAILLRRLRDPQLTSAGVSVLMRYTLRLLTLDQLGRASTLMCALELLRQERPDQLGRWPFEIGLWVGKAATPNRMGAVGDTDRTTARAKTIAYANNSRKAAPVPVENCPWCGTKLKNTSFVLAATGPDGRPRTNTDHPDQLRIACPNFKCTFRGSNPLPIVAVDEPIYRRLPCFVIATVDKFATLPWTGEAGLLLGGADRYDAAGFYGAAAPTVGQPLSKPLAPPDLIIQDELHLISGPLGTMAGLYETVIDALCTRSVEGHDVRPKIVASTATVRRAESQIRALFARANGVEVFPPPGPDRRSSFFAETVALSQSPGRQYLGVAAQGRSLKVVLLRTYLALLPAAQKCWEEAGGAKNADNPADPYMTLVGYFNALRELGGSRRIVEDEVASQVTVRGGRRRVGEKEGSFVDRTISRDVCELTSRESTDKVSDAKRRLAIGFSEKGKTAERVDVALATNMISVGLDITRLGLMVVLGQPKATAEYIQATSRVGREREKPGLVVTLLNIHRPRDRSHYERFCAYHESFYRAVEATSVTPFSPRALDRALPALVVSLARHGRRVMTPAPGAMAIVEERAALEGIATTITERARAHRQLSPEDERRLNAYIATRTKELLDAWARLGRTLRHVSASLRYQRHEGSQGKPLLRLPLDTPDPDLGRDGLPFKASRSLRDVEPSVALWVKRFDGVDIEPPSEDQP